MSTQRERRQNKISNFLTIKILLNQIFILSIDVKNLSCINACCTILDLTCIIAEETF